MRLGKENLFPYLIGRSWIDAEALVAGDAVVIERRLRHTSFVVEQRGGRGLFVKQLHDPHPEAAASLRREAELYASIAEGRLPELGPLVPAYVGYDEHERVLALARFEGPSAQDRAVAGRPPVAVEAVALGTAVATVHRITAETARGATTEALGGELPWAFHLAHAIAYSPTPVPGAGTAMLGVLRSHPQLEQWLGQLASWWRQGTLIHGDLKWENVLLASNGAEEEGAGDGTASEVDPTGTANHRAGASSGPGGTSNGRVCLIDWELASSGDPAWDVATLLQAPLVRTCLVRARAEALASSDLAPHHEALRAFAAAWVEGFAPQNLERESARILAFTAVRLVYSAYEHAAISPQIHPAILAMVSTAWQMLRDRRHAAHLLGFEA